MSSPKPRRALSARLRRTFSILAAILLVQAPARAQTEAKVSSGLREEIDRIVRKALARTGVPSASVAIVQDGRIVYVQAYGVARLETKTPALPEMRYSIGSISKQFTATAILMLAEENKLSLDDPVGKYLPTLTRANDVTIRQLLSHTSGYQDYWPQDYVPPFMRREVTSEEILDRWARKPLDFEPGTQRQYSNTGYVIAGLIAERASGMPLLDFLRARAFAPLGMENVTDIDRHLLSESDPVGYLRYALGPPRVAPKEGRGWLFAAGELAMTARDLAKWNVGLLERRLLKPASYAEMEREVVLQNGLGTRYGLGLSVHSQFGRRVLAHDGEVSGFTALNAVFPDDRIAISVLTNQDAAEAAATISERLAPLLFAKSSVARIEARSRSILESLQRGRIDRSLFTENANSYFSDEAIRDFSSSLGPLGKPREFRQTEERDRGGMTFRLFVAKLGKKSVQILERDMPDGKIEQYQVVSGD
jgi:CubicO group peptidase (beta-lactamase class C family)